MKASVKSRELVFCLSPGPVRILRNHFGDAHSCCAVIGSFTKLLQASSPHLSSHHVTLSVCLCVKRPRARVSMMTDDFCHFLSTISLSAVCLPFIIAIPQWSHFVGIAKESWIKILNRGSGSVKQSYIKKKILIPISNASSCCYYVKIVYFNSFNVAPSYSVTVYYTIKYQWNQ